MDDLIRLLNTLPVAANDGSGKDAAADPLLAVATVVNTRGSAYRRPGARMLVRRSMAAQGAVSAGCLERDVIANCEAFKENPRSAPLLLTYDGNSADELVFGLKLGCDGVVQVLVEPAGEDSLYQGRARDLKLLLPEILSGQKRAVVVTIFDAYDMEGGSWGDWGDDNESDDEADKGEAESIAAADVVGTCLVETGSETHTLIKLPEILGKYLSAQAKILLSTRNPRSIVLQENVEGWLVSALVEVVEAIPSILICGAGQDVQPLTEMIEVIGWRSTVSDGKWAASGPFVSDEQFDAAVIMTHDYERDRLILRELIKTDVAYIGLVGPRRRADKLVAELALEGQPITGKELSRLYSPVGLDIGAERPEEIALSILAEIKASLSGHVGGMLREKQGPIHEPSAATGIPESICEKGQEAGRADNAVTVQSAVIHKTLNNSCAVDNA